MILPMNLRLPLALICLAAPALLGPARAETLSESDQILLGMVQNACKTNDYRTLFDAMAKSPVILRRFTAATVEMGTVHRGGTEEARQVPGADYPGLPVAMRDYSYVPAPTAGDDPTIGLMVEFNQAGDARVSVEWTRVRFVQPPGGGDEVGTPVHLDGSPWVSGDPTDGQLLLYPTDTCFELVADTRYVE